MVHGLPSLPGAEVRMWQGDRMLEAWPPSRHPDPALATSSAWTPPSAVNPKESWGPGWSCGEKGPLGPQIDRRIIAASGEGGGMEVPLGGKLAWK